MTEQASELSLTLEVIDALRGRLRNVHRQLVRSLNPGEEQPGKGGDIETVLLDLTDLGVDLAAVRDCALSFSEHGEDVRGQVRLALDGLDGELGELDRLMREISGQLRDLLDNQATRRRAVSAYGAVPPFVSGDEDNLSAETGSGPEDKRARR